MGRNLVVCLDGTDNQFSATNTNVVRTFQALDRDTEAQVAYYHPGVGTIWEPGTLSKSVQKIQMLLGLAFGLGVTRDVAQAYRFLMEQHRVSDDRIFIFGFSRGALEARALAGLLHRCGLLEPQLAALEPYAVRLFQTPGDYTVVGDFQATFSRRVTVAFLGLWDTVTSMGNVWSPVHWPYTTTNPSVERVAHAIAIDERRAFFRQNRWRATAGQQVAQAWFAGVHSDVGGGYPVATGRLWAITLRWMLDHATAAGLAVDDQRVDDILQAGQQDPPVPDAETAQHDSLTAAWKPFELVPRPRRPRRADGTYGPTRLFVPAFHSGFRGRARILDPGERVHRSALERFVARNEYRPETLLEAGVTLDIARQFVSTTEEYWQVPGATAGPATD